MAGKRRSRPDRILPASLDAGPAGGSVTSASPPVPIPEDPLHPGGVSSSGNSAPAPGNRPWPPPYPYPLPELRSLPIPCFFFHPFFSPTAPFLLKSTTEQGNQNPGMGKNQSRPSCRGASSALQSSDPPQNPLPAKNPKHGPQLTLRVCPRPPAPLSPPATPRHSCPHIWRTKGRVALELSPLLGGFGRGQGQQDPPAALTLGAGGGGESPSPSARPAPLQPHNPRSPPPPPPLPSSLLPSLPNPPPPHSSPVATTCHPPEAAPAGCALTPAAPGDVPEGWKRSRGC